MTKEWNSAVIFSTHKKWNNLNQFKGRELLNVKCKVLARLIARKAANILIGDN